MVADEAIADALLEQELVGLSVSIRKDQDYIFYAVYYFLGILEAYS